MVQISKTIENPGRRFIGCPKCKVLTLATLVNIFLQICHLVFGAGSMRSMVLDFLLANLILPLVLYLASGGYCCERSPCDAPPLTP